MKNTSKIIENVDFFGFNGPFLRHLGVMLEVAENGKSIISLEIRPEFLNTLSNLHGGLVMTMLDVAMAVAVRSTHEYVDGVLTIDMSTSIIRPTKKRIIAKGKILHAGNSLHFCEGEAFNEDNELVAKSLGTFKLYRK